IGLATLSTKGDGTKVLDTWYPIMSVDREADPTKAVLAAAGADGATGTTVVDADALRAGARRARKPEVKALLAGLAEALALPVGGADRHPRHLVAAPPAVVAPGPPAPAEPRRDVRAARERGVDRPGSGRSR